MHKEYDIKIIEQMLNEKKNMTDIAAYFNVSQPALAQYLKRNYIKRIIFIPKNQLGD